MAVGALLGAIVEVLDDDGLAASVAALQEHDHLVGLEELHHGGGLVGSGARRLLHERWRKRASKAPSPAINPIALTLIDRLVSVLVSGKVSA